MGHLIYCLEIEALFGLFIYYFMSQEQILFGQMRDRLNTEPTLTKNAKDRVAWLGVTCGYMLQCMKDCLKDCFLSFVEERTQMH